MKSQYEIVMDLINNGTPAQFNGFASPGKQNIQKFLTGEGIPQYDYFHLYSPINPSYDHGGLQALRSLGLDLGDQVNPNDKFEHNIDWFTTPLPGTHGVEDFSNDSIYADVNKNPYWGNQQGEPSDFANAQFDPVTKKPVYSEVQSFPGNSYQNHYLPGGIYRKDRTRTPLWK